MADQTATVHSEHCQQGVPHLYFSEIQTRFIRRTQPLILGDQVFHGQRACRRPDPVGADTAVKAEADAIVPPVLAEAPCEQAADQASLRVSANPMRNGRNSWQARNSGRLPAALRQLRLPAERFKPLCFGSHAQPKGSADLRHRSRNPRQGAHRTAPSRHSLLRKRGLWRCFAVQESEDSGGGFYGKQPSPLAYHISPWLPKGRANMTRPPIAPPLLIYRRHGAGGFDIAQPSYAQTERQPSTGNPGGWRHLRKRCPDRLEQDWYVGRC